MSSDLLPDNGSAGPPEGESGGDQLRVYLRALSRRRWWAIGAVALWLLIAVVHVELATPIYSASAKVLVSSPASSATAGASALLGSAAGALSSLLPASSPLLPGGDVGTEIEIMRTWVTRNRAALLLAEHTRYVRDVTIGRGVYWTDDQLPASWTDVEDPQGKRMDQAMYQTEKLDDPVAARALRATSVQRGRDSPVVTVETQAPDLQVAADVCNATCLAYLVGKRLSALNANKAGQKYVNGEVLTPNEARAAGQTKEPGAREQLEKAEGDLLDFQRQVHLVNGTDDVAALVRQSTDLRKQRMDLNSQITSLRAQLASLKTQLEGESPVITGASAVTEPPEVTSLRNRLAQLYAQRSDLTHTYQPTSTEVQAVDRQIADLTKQIQAAGARRFVTGETKTPNPAYQQLRTAISTTSAGLRAAEAQMGPVDDACKAAEAELHKLPAAVVKIVDLRTEVEIAQQRYLAARQMGEQLRLVGGAEATNVRIIAPARDLPDAVPVSPRPQTDIALGLMLGLVSAVLLVFLLERLDDTYPNRAALQEDLPWPIMGLLPAAGEAERRVPREAGASPTLAKAVSSALANLRLAAEDRPLGSLLVTSSAPGDGKTTAAVDLAHAAARGGQRVVLIDASLGEPTVHEFLGVSGEPGLADLLVEHLDLETCLQAVPSDGGSGQLWLLPAGSPSSCPAVLFGSAAMARLLEQLRDRADLVIIDGPSLASADDGRALLDKADSVLLVLDEAHARREAVRAAKGLLTKAGSRVVGVLVNRSRRSA